MRALSVGEIRGLTVCELFKKKFLVTQSLQFHLRISQTLEEAAALIEKWGDEDDVRYELAHDLQEALCEATGQNQCGTCHWSIKPGQGCCDDDLDLIEPLDDYPEDATNEDWDNAFGSLAGENPDDDLLDIDSDAYVMMEV